MLIKILNTRKYKEVSKCLPLIKKRKIIKKNQNITNDLGYICHIYVSRFNVFVH